MRRGVCILEVLALLCPVFACSKEGNGASTIVAESTQSSVEETAEDNPRSVRRHQEMKPVPSADPTVLRGFLQDLRNAEDSSGRYEALERLTAFGPEAIRPLLEAMNDKDAYTRGFAAYGVSKVGDHRLISDPDGRRAIVKLELLLSDREVFDFGYGPPIFVAHAAADTLAGVGTGASSPSLFRALDVAQQFQSQNRLIGNEAIANRQLIAALNRAIDELRFR